MVKLITFGLCLLFADIFLCQENQENRGTKYSIMKVADAALIINRFLALLLYYFYVIFRQEYET